MFRIVREEQAFIWVYRWKNVKDRDERPDRIHFADSLPKTRSGKIVRRILRKIAEGEWDRERLGDTTTLADPSLVDYLLSTRP